MEAALLCAFMLSAFALTASLQHHASPLRHLVDGDAARRALTGIGMGLTAAALIYSPWGRRSGAHLNPSITLTFYRLGKIRSRDVAGYVAAQFAGAAAGVAVASVILRGIAASPDVNYIATVPGSRGIAAAFAGEAAISFGMMAMVLVVSNTARGARFTGAFAACLVAIYIAVESPLSGMSMNPARSLAPAFASGTLGTIWIYVAAPLLGMLLAAELYIRRYGVAAVRCAKLHHPENGACHFHCRRDAAEATQIEGATR